MKAKQSAGVGRRFCSEQQPAMLVASARQALEGRMAGSAEGC